MAGVDPSTVAHAHWQIERETAARELVARGAGLALIELSAVLEHGETYVRPGVDPLGFVLLAFAARARRLIRSAFRLMDAGEASEAAPLLRVVSEIEIVALWVKKNPDRLGDWAIRDHDRRDLTYRKILAELDDADAIAGVEKQREELASRRSDWVKQFGELTRGIPSVEVMATETGLGFAYQLAYRVQSQSDVHATPLSVDSFYEEQTDGTVLLRPVPNYGLAAFGSYSMAAHLLLDVLTVTNDHMKALLWTTGLTGIRDGLTALRSSDPRTQEDPAGHLLEAVEEVDAPADG